ncbi:hypothetical protein CaCOL14_003666 [Colletotrichum acutatum]
MAYMQELQAVRSSRIGTETLGAVGQIYTYLSKNCRNLKGDAKDKLRSVMELVYHPQSGWVPLDTCVWQGLSYLPNSLALANIYPASAELFQRTLGVADVSVAEIVKELVRVDKIPGSSRDHSLLKITILALSESLGKGQPSLIQVNDALRDTMRNLKIFTMVSTPESSGEPPGVVYRSIDQDCQNQMNLAWKYAFKHGKTPSDVFLIGRVYNVEKEKPGLKFYWNPWEMINKGSLVMTVSDGYRIAPGNAAVTSKAA